MAVPEDEVLGLVKQVNRIYASVGKRVVTFDLKKEKPSNAEIFKAVCRNGKLRAPALRKGKTLIVGFNEETYSKLFG